MYMTNIAVHNRTSGVQTYTYSAKFKKMLHLLIRPRKIIHLVQKEIYHKESINQSNQCLYAFFMKYTNQLPFLMRV